LGLGFRCQLSASGWPLSAGCWLLATGRCYLQQSPGQHDDPPWQQLAPQQLPGQHFAPDVQQDAPVSASADSENSDVAIKAITFAFIGIFLSV
jgi:hypothetical protein